MDALLAPRALPELVFLVTLIEKMEVHGLNLDDLVALLALSEHGAVLPEVQVHGLPDCK